MKKREEPSVAHGYTIFIWVPCAIHYWGTCNEQGHVVPSIADAINKLKDAVVYVFVDQQWKTVLCVLLHLLQTVNNRDKVRGGGNS